MNCYPDAVEISSSSSTRSVPVARTVAEVVSYGVDEAERQRVRWRETIRNIRLGSEKLFILNMFGRAVEELSSQDETKTFFLIGVLPPDPVGQIARAARDEEPNAARAFPMEYGGPRQVSKWLMRASREYGFGCEIERLSGAIAFTFRPLSPSVMETISRGSRRFLRRAVTRCLLPLLRSGDDEESDDSLGEDGRGKSDQKRERARSV